MSGTIVWLIAGAGVWVAGRRDARAAGYHEERTTPRGAARQPRRWPGRAAHRRDRDRPARAAARETDERDRARRAGPATATTPAGERRQRPIDPAQHLLCAARARRDGCAAALAHRS